MGNEIEIYWTGRAYDFDGNAGEPGLLHDVWRQADAQGLRVMRVRGTDDGHQRRPFVPAPSSSEAEKKYEQYLATGAKRAGKRPDPTIKVKA